MEWNLNPSTIVKLQFVTNHQPLNIGNLKLNIHRSAWARSHQHHLGYWAAILKKWVIMDTIFTQLFDFWLPTSNTAFSHRNVMITLPSLRATQITRYFSLHSAPYRVLSPACPAISPRWFYKQLHTKSWSNQCSAFGVYWLSLWPTLFMCEAWLPVHSVQPGWRACRHHYLPSQPHASHPG